MGQLLLHQRGEPFGLVPVESMACGTPVIACNKGAVPEIVVDGKTGFVADSMNTMIKAVDQIDSIDPGDCRRHVENHFSITGMAGKYSELYNRILYSHKAIDRSRFSTSHPFKASTPWHKSRIGIHAQRYSGKQRQSSF